MPSAPPQIFPLVSQPGVQRDGTALDSSHYTDGQWVRWQRGRPRKMGGYSAMTSLATGPFRSLYVDSRAGANTVHSFTPWGIERLQFDRSGGAIGAITDRTPPGGGGSGCTLGTVSFSGTGVSAIAVVHSGSQYASAPLVFITGNGTGATAHAVLTNGVVTSVVTDTPGTGYSTAAASAVGFAYNSSYSWQEDLMWAGSGSSYAALIAASTPDLDDISSDATGYIWNGDPTQTTPFQPLLDVDGLTPIQVSGGCCVLQPFLVVYGSDGLIRNSDANQISGASGWTVGGGGFSSSANVSGTKVVKGLPMRGGTASPAGLFWSLDSLVRMTFVGGTNFWNYDTISDDTSILAKNSVIEYDNVYYWLAVDRFMSYTGVVQEVPNQLNTNWFFDNVNYAACNKIFAVKVARFGEIHWFYPRGSSTECNAVIIYNVREQTWYDNVLSRSAGYAAKVFNKPVMAGTEDAVTTTVLPYTLTSGTNFSIGDVVTGQTSSAAGTVLRVTDTKLNLANVSGTFSAGETIKDAALSESAVVNFIPTVSQIIAPIWQHEVGHDKVVGSSVLAIPSWFQTSIIGFPTGGPMEAEAGRPAWMQQPGNSVDLRVQWIEPDIIQTGNLTVSVIGTNYANGVIETTDYDIPAGTTKLDVRDQRRLMSFKVSSNVQGGYYEMGATMAMMAPGDIRG